MRPLERLANGSWHVTFQSGRVQSDTFAWGPGRHSMRIETHGPQANGDPSQRGVDVLYWHPGTETIRLLGIDAAGRRQLGTLRPAGDTLHVDYEFFSHYFRPAEHRELAARYAFEGEDRLVYTLLEDGGSGLQPLVELDYARADGPVAPHPEQDHLPPAEELEPLRWLVGPTWSATATSDAGAELRIRSRFAFVPNAHALHGRTEVSTAGGPFVLIRDLYVHAFPRDGTLRVLGLDASGRVEEGTLRVDAAGSLALDLRATRGSDAFALERSIRLGPDGSWTEQDRERTPSGSRVVHSRSFTRDE